MTRGIQQAITPQALTRSLAAHLRSSLRTVEVGEIVTQGLDGGKEFTFTAVCKDGSEMLVSVMQTKASPVPEGRKAQDYIKVSNLADVVAARNAERERRGRETLARDLATRERRRKRFLGED